MAAISPGVIIMIDGDTSTAEALQSGKDGCIYFTTDHDIIINKQMYGGGNASISSIENETITEYLTEKEE